MGLVRPMAHVSVMFGVIHILPLGKGLTKNSRNIVVLRKSVNSEHAAIFLFDVNPGSE